MEPNRVEIIKARNEAQRENRRQEVNEYHNEIKVKSAALFKSTLEEFISEMEARGYPFADVQTCGETECIAYKLYTRRYSDGEDTFENMPVTLLITAEGGTHLVLGGDDAHPDLPGGEISLPYITIPTTLEEYDRIPLKPYGGPNAYVFNEYNINTWTTRMLIYINAAKQLEINPHIDPNKIVGVNSFPFSDLVQELTYPSYLPDHMRYN